VTYLGEVCALGAPLCWAFAVIWFKRTAGASPVAMNVFKNGTALILLTATMGIFGVGLPIGRSGEDWLRLVLSGVLGLAVGDTLFFASLARLGAARIALVDLVYAPTVVALSWLLLGEQLGHSFLLGTAAVLGGVTLASLDPRALVEERPADVRAGVLFGVAGIVGTAVGVILAKPVLEHSNLIEVTWTRLLAGVVAQALWLSAARGWAPVLPVLRPSPLWRTLLPAAVMGTYFSLLLWLGGFKWANASVAAVLNQMATIYILVLARVWLGEPLSARRIAGAGVAIVGAVAIVLGK